MITRIIFPKVFNHYLSARSCSSTRSDNCFSPLADDACLLQIVLANSQLIFWNLFQYLQNKQKGSRSNRLSVLVIALYSYVLDRSLWVSSFEMINANCKTHLRSKKHSLQIVTTRNKSPCNNQLFSLLTLDTGQPFRLLFWRYFSFA